MIKKFNEYKINESDRTYPGEGSEIDYDYILDKIKDEGWGDISSEYFDDFEDSKYFSGDLSNTETYLSEFIEFMNKGFLDHIPKKDQREVQENNWVLGILEDWAETYRDDEDNEDGENGYDMIMSLIDKLENDTCTKEDYKEILFHMWQAIGQE